MLQLIGICLIGSCFLFLVIAKNFSPIALPWAMLEFAVSIIAMGAGTILLWQGYFYTRESEMGPNRSAKITISLVIALIGSTPGIYYVGGYLLNWFK